MFTTFEAWLKWQEFGLGTVEVLGSIPCHKINIYEKTKNKKNNVITINQSMTKTKSFPPRAHSIFPFFIDLPPLLTS